MGWQGKPLSIPDIAGRDLGGSTAAARAAFRAAEARERAILEVKRSATQEDIPEAKVAEAIQAAEDLSYASGLTFPQALLNRTWPRVRDDYEANQ